MRGNFWIDDGDGKSVFVGDDIGKGVLIFKNAY